MNTTASKRIVKLSYFMLIFLILQAIMFSVNICPPDKNPTEITIEHSRHPQNIPIGVYNNTIEVTIHLNAIDRNTQKKIPLANKEVLIELTIGSKFIRNASGDFVLSDEPAPFPVNTTENGIISFTIYTQPPLLENVTDPRKISYAITASYTPKPREPLLGSTKTERYVPGIFPVISMAACGPLFIIFAVLIAAMFAAGKNPFGLFDFTRVAFKAPGISGGRVTPRVKTTVAGIVAGAAQGGVKYASKAGVAKLGQSLVKEQPMPEGQEKSKFGRTLIKGMQTLLRGAGKIILVPVSKRVGKKGEQNLQDVKKKEEKIKGQQPASEKLPQNTQAQASKNQQGKEKSNTGLGERTFTGIFGKTKVITAPEFSMIGLLDAMKAALISSISQFGQRPWSLSYAQISQRPSVKLYSKEEQEKLKNTLNKTYHVDLEVGIDIDKYGLTEAGKRKIAEKLGIGIEQINQLVNLIIIKNPAELDRIKNEEREKYLKEKLLKGETPTEEEINKEVEKRTNERVIKILEEEARKSIERRIEHQFREGYLRTKPTDEEIQKEAERQARDKYQKLQDEEYQKYTGRIANNGALIGFTIFDKENWIKHGSINGAEYYKAFGIDEIKSRGEYLSLLANAHGINYDSIVQALDSGDPTKIKKVLNEEFERVKNDPTKLIAFNEIIKPVQIGIVNKYLSETEQNEFIKKGYSTEELTQKVINGLFREKSDLVTSKTMKEAIKATLGEKTEINERNVLGLVLNGEQIVQAKIENLEKELKNLKSEYITATPGSIGDERIKAKEKEIDSAKNDLLNVKNVIENIKSETENLIFAKKIYDQGRELGQELKYKSDFTQIFEPTPKALFNSIELDKAILYENSGKATYEIKSAVEKGKGEIDRLTQTLNNLNKIIPGEKPSEIDKLIGDGLKKFKEKHETLKQEINSINNNESAFKLPEKFDLVEDEVSKIKSDIEWEIKKGNIANREEESRYKTYINTLNEINNTLNDTEKIIKNKIKEHRNLNTDGSIIDNVIEKVDKIDYKNINENGIDPQILKDIKVPNTAIYYLRPDAVKLEEKKKEEEEFNDWFFGRTYKVGTTTIERGDRNIIGSSDIKSTTKTNKNNKNE